MSGFFKYDGPFFRFGSMLADVMILSLLWVVCSLPVITAGASTCAYYYAMTKRITDADGGVAKLFFKSFLRELPKATLALILLGAGAGAVFWGAALFREWLAADEVTAWHYVLQAIVYVDMFEAAALCVYVFPLLSRFSLGFGQLFKTAFVMAHKHIFTTVTLLVTLAALIAVTMMNLSLIVLIPGIYGFMSAHFLMRIFRKYRPDIVRPPASDEELQPLNLGEDGE